MQFYRSISFIYSWKYTLFITVILSVFTSLILILLKPFDTYLYIDSYKNIKLTGYSLSISIPILFLHIIENLWFLKSDKKWTLFKELMILLLGFVSISMLAYLYNSTVINSVEINLKEAIYWSISYGLPFASIFISLWAYLRFRFSKIPIHNEIKQDETLITINGKNNKEQIQLKWSDFVMAKSQSNYVDVYLINKIGDIQKHVLRSTLSNLVEQLPMAKQVHRSYLINIAFISSLKGNSRQGTAVLEKISTEIPISPKYFSVLKKNLQLHP